MKNQIKTIAIAILTITAFPFVSDAKPTTKIKIKIDAEIHGKGGATLGNPTKLCPETDDAICFKGKLEVEVEVGMTPNPGDIVTITNTDEVFTNQIDGSQIRIRLLTPNRINIGQDSKIHLSGENTYFEIID
jgi:hypothetical protein